VVWCLDRFGRSLKDLVAKIEFLDERGVEFVSLTEGVDTTTAQGRLAFHLFGALADFEREIDRERIMAGIQTARERGRVGRRPRALSEYDLPQV
jgi:DNA invertase Pin-like site-specific DNA recombinase